MWKWPELKAWLQNLTSSSSDWPFGAFDSGVAIAFALLLVVSLLSLTLLATFNAFAQEC